MLTLEPLTFNGERNYALSNVLEFEVTDGFINLGEEVTKCQNRESYEECSTREFLKLAWEKCACTPFSLSHLNDTVGIIKVFQRFIILFRWISALLLDWIVFDRLAHRTCAFLHVEDCTLMSMWTRIFHRLRAIWTLSLHMRVTFTGKKE